MQYKCYIYAIQKKRLDALNAGREANDLLITLNFHRCIMFNRNPGSAVTQCLLLSGLLLGAMLCWKSYANAFNWTGQRVRWQSLPRESPDSVTSQTHPGNTNSFTLPYATRAVVIDPSTQAVTLRAIDSQQRN
jgi:hypothetical protein